MKPGEKIREFRKSMGLNQIEFGKTLGYSDAYISNIEKGKVEPSREFLKKLKEIFNVPSDYILYSDTAAQWDKVEGKLRSKGLSDEEIRDIRPDYLGAFLLGGYEERQRRHKHAMKISEPKGKYKILPVPSRKLLDNVIEILESGDEGMVHVLKANIQVFLEAIRSKKGTEK
jgi:transcriptional regulator with XRE-family HTH domain